MKTWHIEHAVVIAVLVGVWVASGCAGRELLGSLAVYLGHGCSSISSRMQERDAARSTPETECSKHYWWYYIGKEAAWFAYFLWAGAWSALVGCCLFAIYPVWRRFWRRRHPIGRS